MRTIGMLWAHLKQDAIDKAKGFLDWLLALAENYLPLAVTAVFGMMMLAAAIVVYVPKMIAALFRRRIPPLKAALFDERDRCRS